MNHLFLFNTALIEPADILLILKLAGLDAKMDFDTEIATAPEGVKKLLTLAKIHHERGGTNIIFNKLMVKPSFDKKKIADVPALENEMIFVYDKRGKEWYLVTKISGGTRFEKKVVDITEEDAKQYFKSMNLEKLKSALNNKSKLTYSEWTQLKSQCFIHPNPIFEIGVLLRRSLDDQNNNKEIKEMRNYLKIRTQKNDTSLLIYANSESFDACGRQESAYVEDNVLAELSQNQSLQTLYIGAGHGWSQTESANKAMLSGLRSSVVTKICDSIKAKGVNVASIILGSCFSASYANEFSELLTSDGVILSSTISQAGENYFKKTVDVVAQNNKAAKVTDNNKSAGFFENLQTINPPKKPTGLCITQKNGHTALELHPRLTGIPKSSGIDEYGINNRIINSLANSRKPANNLMTTLDDCNEQKQKAKFNELLAVALAPPQITQPDIVPPVAVVVPEQTNSLKSPIPIRLLTAADKKQVLELDRNIFGAMDGGWFDWEFDHFFNTNHCFVFHEEGDPNKINGYIFARQSNRGTYIINLGVKKECEGHNIGKELMKKVMLQESERSKNISFSTRLHVSSNNVRALNFYKRLGYQEVSYNRNDIEMEAKALPEIFRDVSLTINEQHVPPLQVNAQAEQRTPEQDKGNPIEAEPVAREAENSKPTVSEALPPVAVQTTAPDIKNQVEDKLVTDTVPVKPPPVVVQVAMQDTNHVEGKVVAKEAEKSKARVPVTPPPVVVQAVQDTKNQVEGKVVAKAAEKSKPAVSVTPPPVVIQPAVQDRKTRVDGKAVAKQVEKSKPAVSVTPPPVVVQPAVQDRKPRIDGKAVAKAAEKSKPTVPVTPPPVVVQPAVQDRKTRIGGKTVAKEAEKSKVTAPVTLPPVVVQAAVQDRKTRIEGKTVAKEAEKIKPTVTITSPQVVVQPAVQDRKTRVEGKVVAKEAEKSKPKVTITSPQVVVQPAVQDRKTRVEGKAVAKEADTIMGVELQPKETPVSTPQLDVQKNQPTATQDSNTKKQDKFVKKQPEDIETNFLYGLKLLNDKIENLKEQREAAKNDKNKYDNLVKACDAATTLYDKLQSEGKAFFDKMPSKDKSDFSVKHNIFKETCQSHIKEARQTLDHHRGWSEFLVNLVIGIATVGFGSLIQGAVNLANNRSFFFVHKTDSAKTLDKVEEWLKKPPSGSSS